MNEFKPVKYIDGYLPIEDHGLIGDGATAALVGRDGAISWMCAPRFDSPPVFCRILDARRGGAFTLAPEGLIESRQFYEPDTAVLVTEMRGPAGLIRVTDALTLRQGADLTEDAAAGRCELLRVAEVIEGNARLRIEIEPRGESRVIARSGGLFIRNPPRPHLVLQLSSSVPLAPLAPLAAPAPPASPEGLRGVMELGEGSRLSLTLRWGGGVSRYRPLSAEDSLAATCDAWRRWAARIGYAGPQKEIVSRSALTLKLLDHFESGAIVAAPTSSLPEVIGGERNWDYRYAWVRDAAFAVTRSTASAVRRKRRPSSVGRWTPWKSASAPDRSMTSTATTPRRSRRTRRLKAIAARVRCAGATRRRSKPNTTFTARFSIAHTSGRRATARSTKRCGKGCVN